MCGKRGLRSVAKGHCRGVRGLRVGPEWVLKEGLGT